MQFPGISAYRRITEHAQTVQNPTCDCPIKILLLVLLLFDGFSTPQYSPANRAYSHVYQIYQTPPAAFVGFRTVYSPVNRAYSHVYQIHQTPPAAFVGFRTVYSQAMVDALHLLLYQFHQSPTIVVPFYRTLMDFGGFGSVCSKNA